MGIVVTVWILSGLLCAFIASQKGRNGLGWFFIGALFGVFAVVAIIAVPSLGPKE